MSDLAIPNTFNSGEIISATKFNENYAAAVDYVNNRNTGAAAWDAVSVAHTTNVPLTVNNLAGTQDIARFQDNGTNVLQVKNGGLVSAQKQEVLKSYGGAVSLVYNTDVLIPYFSMFQNHSNMEEGGTGKFTAAQAGKYFVFVNIYTMLFNQSTKGATSGFVISIYKNGSAVSTKTTGPMTLVIAGDTRVGCFIQEDVLSLAVGDYLQTYVKLLSNVGGVLYAGGAATGNICIAKLS